MTLQIEVQSCQAPVRGAGAVRIVAWTPTLIASAVLFSMFFASDGFPAWLGVLGIVPLVLRLTGCPTCGGTRQSPAGGSWPGH